MTDTVITGQDTTDTGTAEQEGAAAEQAKATDTTGADAGNAGVGAANAQGEQGKDGEQKGDDEAGAPEQYEFKVPEGMVLDDGAVAAFEPEFRALGLSNEKAQGLVNIFAEKVVPVWLAKQAEAQAQQIEGWRSSAQSDAEIGGTGFDGNVKAAVTAIDRFGTPELKQALDATGMGDHPELIRFCVRVGKAIGEDAVAAKPAVGGATKSLADRMYGNNQS